MPGTPAEVWWPREAAETLGLPALASRIVKVPRAQWESAVRAYYAPMVAQREAGDRVEAVATSLAQATPYLRLVLMREQAAPPGDVRFPGPLPGTIEVLALDTKVSDRYVSERLAAAWGEPLEQVRTVAEAQVLALTIDEADRAHAGRPSVRSYSLESHGGYIGPVIRHLAERLPDAMGPFGAYVGVPTPGGLIVRPLAAGMDLRGDLGEVALLCQAVWDKATTRIDPVPFWLRPDGKIVPGPLRLDEAGAAGSFLPGLAGVLAALDPRELLPVAGWAQGKLSPDLYVRFAGCVSAELGYAAPEEVAKLGSGLGLAALADACGSAPFATWPDAIREHLQREKDAHEDVRTLASGEAEDRDTALAALVTWIDAPAADLAAEVAQPVGETGFVEVLGIMANGHAQVLKPPAAAALGPADELFARGREAIRASLQVTASPAELLSGEEVIVTGHPSPTAAIPHLMAWLPDVVGPFGAFVAAGDAWRLNVLPIPDAFVALDLPSMLGAAAGAAMGAEWPIPPSVFWLGPDRLEVLHLEVSDGVVTGVTSSADVALLITRLPAEPRRLPPGLEEILGPDGARRFYGLLHAAVVERLGSDPAGLAELSVASIREAASRCAPRPREDWPGEIRGWMDAMAAPRRELDRLTLSSDYSAVGPSLQLKISRRELAGSQLARDVGGGLAVYPVIDSARRSRRVTHAMLERWQVDGDRCHADAASNTAHDPNLVDEPMYADQPAVRQLYSPTAEREAAGLCLHLRHPGTRRGFIVSITHGSRAHYIRLDDAGAVSTIPVFAKVIADIYRNADRAADAHSPWLFWLKPGGPPIELFNVLEPTPPIDRLPPEFVAMVRADGPGRPH